MAPSMVGITTAAVVTATAAAAAWAAWELARRRHQREREALLEDWQSRRQQERTGRIRAEVQLRALRKEHQLLLLGTESEQQAAQPPAETTSKSKNGASPATTTPTTDPSSRLLLTAIGTVVSPFVKRMGTPRQPQLAPSARGYLHLNNVPPPCLDGLEDYSHAWVLFAFHANTDDHRASNKRRTKVRPPRAPANVKVGQLATRSPHRPNPIGLSLIRIEQWDAATRRLHISGLDLVHGTPIFDVKPCVPWDIPGYYDCQRRAGVGAVTTASSNDATTATRDVAELLLNHWKSVLRVPDWVSNDTDELGGVEFRPSTLEQLDECVSLGLLAPLYAPHNKGAPAAAQTLREILLQDPRSSHTVGVSGGRPNGGTTTTGRRNNRQRGGGNDDDKPSAAPSAVKPYSLLFGRCRVDFVVRERRVTVEAVVSAASDGTHGANGCGVPPFMAEGIPLRITNHPQVPSTATTATTTLAASTSGCTSRTPT